MLCLKSALRANNNDLRNRAVPVVFELAMRQASD